LKELMCYVLDDWDEREEIHNSLEDWVYLSSESPDSSLEFVF